METPNFNSKILNLTSKIQDLRKGCDEFGVPTYIQDGYEEIIDNLICYLGVTAKQRELFWTITDPE